MTTIHPDRDPMTLRPYFCRECRAKRTNAGGPPAHWLSLRIMKTRVRADESNVATSGLFCSRDCLIGFVTSLRGIRAHAIEPEDPALVGSLAQS